MRFTLTLWVSDQEAQLLRLDVTKRKIVADRMRADMEQISMPSGRGEVRSADNGQLIEDLTLVVN